MKLKDASRTPDERLKQKAAVHKTLNSSKNELDVIPADRAPSGDQQATEANREQPLAGMVGSMHPDPLLLVALHASRPRLLTLDDLLAARCVCKAWKQRLGTAFCHTIRVPHSLWHEASSPRFSASITAAAAAYPQATALLLDAGGCRPGLPPSIWPPLLQSLNPWLSQSSSNGSNRCIHLRLQAPPSPKRLDALGQLQNLTHLQLQHTSQSLYTRHLTAIANLVQLQSLVLVMMHPRLDLRSLAHQRARRAPLHMDCLSALVLLTQLELKSKGPTGELLPDTIATFTHAASLAALSSVRCLSLSEAAMPAPLPVSDWLQPLSNLQQLQLVQVDEPGKQAGQRRGRATAGSSSSSCTAAAGVQGASGLSGGLFGAGGFGALAAAAATAGRTGGSEQQQQLQALLPGLGYGNGCTSNGTASARHASAAGSSSRVQQQQQQQQHAGPAASSAGGALGSQTVRTSSSSSDADPAMDPPALPALDLSGVLPNLSSLHVANLAGDRLVQLKIPTGLTKLALHLANPCPGAVTGEQLAAVVLQSSQTLVALELGLGMRFSLSGGVMRSLKRGLKGLKDLTLVEGTQDHLEGLGCWCNLRRLELIEGRCSVPLRGLYELSMRAAMGKTPGVLRYCGHVRHVEELAGRLGSALQELRLDSLIALGSPSRCSLLGTGSSEQLTTEPGSSSPDSSGGGSSSAAADEPASAPPLAQLVALTRLEIVGERLGQLESSSAAALGSLKQLVVLEISGQEAWLVPQLGVKEQLSWLKDLRQLRQLRLSGVMLGRAKLAGSSSSSTAGVSPTSEKATTSSSSSSSSSAGGSRASKVTGNCVPPVKGLGNGLACSNSSSSAGGSNKAAAAAASPPSAAAAAASVLDPVAAAARDLAVSIASEEVRRWLCQLLPCCRVWLD